MADLQLRSVLRKLQHVIVAQGGAWALSDEQLLQTFLDRQEAMAVEVLVWRHANMVLNVCRRILRDEHQAEDAFQATFLVFVRKANTIGKGQSLSSWLYKVAYRVACRLRVGLAKKLERSASDTMSHVPDFDPTDDPPRREISYALDEEIYVLPEKYRAPIVLCHLQGHTTEEAAELLGYPKKTIQTHLRRGRDRLKYRLIRRGLALSAGWCSTQLPAKASGSSMPAALVEKTVQTAMQFAIGNMPGGLHSSTATSLAQGVSRTMFMAKLKKIIASMIAVVVLALGTGSVVQWSLADFQQYQKTCLAEAFNQSSNVTCNSLSQEQPNPLPAELVAAWEKAGAKTGWCRRKASFGEPVANYSDPFAYVQPFGYIRFTDEWQQGDVPAFYFNSWREGVLPKLPQPDRPFAIFIRNHFRFEVQNEAGELTDAGLKELAGLRSLQALDLIFCRHVTDAGLKELVWLPNLQSLQMYSWAVTDDGLKHLAGIKSLKDLVFNTKECSDVALKHLSKCFSLERIVYCGSGQGEITEVGIRELATLKSLQSLVLQATPVSEAGFAALVWLKSLRELDLEIANVTDDTLKQIGNLKSLQMLGINHSREITDAGLKELASLKSLQNLRLYGTHISDEGFKELKGLKSLQSLGLTMTQVGGTGLKDFALLKSINLGLVPGSVAKFVNNDSLKALASLKSLQELKLENQGVEDEGLMHLAELTALQTLALDGTKVTDAGLKALKGLKALRTLELNKTEISDAGLKDLAGLTSLQILKLGETQVTDAGLQELSGMKSMRYLNNRARFSCTRAAAQFDVM